MSRVACVGHISATLEMDLPVTTGVGGCTPGCRPGIPAVSSIMPSPTENCQLPMTNAQAWKRAIENLSESQQPGLPVVSLLASNG